MSNSQKTPLSSSLRDKYLRETVVPKKIKENKAAIVIAAMLIMLINLTILIVITTKGYDKVYIGFAAALFGVDFLFFATTFITNYRFLYSRVQIIVYTVISAILLALLIVTTGYGSYGDYVFAIVAIVLLIFTHVMSWAAVWFLAHLAKNQGGNKFGKNNILRIAVVVFLVAMCLGYTTYNLEVGGFFGQNKGLNLTQKTLVYNYVNEDGGYYSVKGVLEGKGELITVPSTFNGKPVKAVSAEIFTLPEIVEVALLGDEIFEIINVEALESFNPDIKVICNKEQIDDYVRLAINLTNSRNSVFMKAFEPIVADDEVFVSFAYDNLNPSSVENIFIPTFIAKKGTEFKPDDLGEFKQFYQNRNNFENSYYQEIASKHRLEDLKVDNGEMLVGKAINESVKAVNVSFERVYRVERQMGSFNYINSNWVKYDYVTASTGNTVDLTTNRIGCYAEWDVYVGSVGSINREFNVNNATLGNFIARLGKHDTRDFFIVPYWKVYTPEITALTSNSTNNNTFTYGENVSLLWETANHELDLVFTLSDKNGVKIFEGLTDINAKNLNKLLPSEGGNYKLSVTATDLFDADLYAKAEKSVNITVNKKEIIVDWTYYGGTVYSGVDKTIIATVESDQFIDDDWDYYGHTQNMSSCLHAATYQFKVTFNDYTKERYIAKNGSDYFSFTVEPRPVTLSWGNTDFTYNGEYQVPTATGYGVFDNALGIVIEGAKRNYADVDKVAFATLDDTDYVIVNPNKEFTIAKAPVVLYWDNINAPSVDFIYNGGAYSRYAESISGDFNYEAWEIINSLSYNGGMINVGSYYTEAYLPEDYNYYIFENGISYFNILQRPIGLYWDTQSFTYNAERQRPTVVGFDNAVYNEDDIIFGLLSYDDGEINYGESYTATVYLNNGGNYIFHHQDYQASIGYSITKFYFVIYADNKEKTYDKQLFTDFTYYLDRDLPGADTISDICDVYFTGTATTEVNVSPDYDGGWIISVNYTNAGTKYDNYYVSTGAGRLTINKAELTITVDNITRDYDGTGQYAFSYSSSSHYEDSLEGDITTFMFHGEAYGAAYYRQNPYVINISASETKAMYDNYDIRFVSGLLQINKRRIEVVKLDNPVITKVYDGSAYYNREMLLGLFTFGTHYYIDNVVNNEVYDVYVEDYSYNSKNCVEADSVWLRFGYLSGSNLGNYDYTSGAYLYYDAEITPMEVTVIKISNGGDPTKVYDGNATATMLENNSHYLLSYKWDIPNEILGVNYTASFDTATVHASTVTAIFGSLVTGTAFIASNYNYTEGTILTYDASITPKDLTITAVGSSKIYDGTDSFGGYSYTHTELAEGDYLHEILSIAYSGSAGNQAINVGDYELNPVLWYSHEKYDNYSIDYVGITLTISPKPLTVTAINQSKVYDGYIYSNGYDFDYTELAQNDNILEIISLIAYNGSATEAGAVNATNYVITPYAATLGAKAGNYDIEYVSGTLTIAPKALTITAVDKQKVYDGQAFYDFEVTPSGLAATDTIDEVLTVGYQGAAIHKTSVNVYDYEPFAVVQREKYNNYDITYVGATLTITPMDLTITPLVASKTYNGEVFYNGFFMSSYSEIATTDTIEQILVIGYSGSATNGINVGKYVITPFALTQNEKYGNYNITFVNGELTINKADLTITAQNKVKDYDGLTYSGFNANIDGKAARDNVNINYDGSAITAKNYSITPYEIVPTIVNEAELLTNYNITVNNGTLTINKAVLTLEKLANPTITKIYDGNTNASVNLTYKTHYNIVNAVAGEIMGLEFVSAAYNTANVTANSVLVTFGSLITGENYHENNYRIGYTSELIYSGTITQKALTIIKTAEPQISKVYDGYNTTAFDFVYGTHFGIDGLVGGDTITNVEVILKQYNSRSVDANRITVYFGAATGLSANYSYATNQTLSYTATITPKALTIAKLSEPLISKVYDGNNSTDFDFTYGTHFGVTGLVAGDTIMGVAITSKLYNSKDVDASYVTLTFGAATGTGPNYTFNTNQTLTYSASITKKTLTSSWQTDVDNIPYLTINGIVASDTAVNIDYTYYAYIWDEDLEEYVETVVNKSQIDHEGSFKVKAVITIIDNNYSIAQTTIEKEFVIVEA